MNKKYMLTLLLIFLGVALSGCGTPKNSELAFLGFFGSYAIFLVSLITMYVFKLFTEREGKNIKTFTKHFFKVNKILILILLGLIIIPSLGLLILDESSEAFFSILFVGVMVLYLGSISTILYTLLLLLLYKKIKKLQKFNYLIPIIITIYYVIILSIIFLYDKSTNEISLFLIWEWPILIFFKTIVSKITFAIGFGLFFVIILFGLIGILMGFFIKWLVNKPRKFKKKFFIYCVTILLIIAIVLMIKHSQEKIEERIKQIILDFKQPTEKLFKKNICYNTNVPYQIKGNILMKDSSDVEIILHMDRGGALSNTEIFINNKSVAHDISNGGYLTFIIAKADVNKGKNNFEIRIHSNIPNEPVSYADFSDNPLNIYKDSKINADELDYVTIN